jgi:mannose-6-phosphate isomerase-like protein (cupin superfamily)
VRKILTGPDDQGRSCVLEVVELESSPVGDGFGVNLARVFATTECPPPSRGPATGRYVDTALEPGMIRWIVVEHPPQQPGAEDSASTTIHHSDSLDLVFVQEGAGDLLLQDGAHPVQAGDLIVMPGVDHAMRPNPGGCRVVVVSIGTPSRS